MSAPAVKKRVADCRKKLRFNTTESAIANAVYSCEKYGIDQYVYKCPLCSNYHLTTSNTGKNVIIKVLLGDKIVIRMKQASSKQYFDHVKKEMVTKYEWVNI